MKFKVDDEIFYDIRDVLDYCISEDYHEDDDEFEEYVNERYGYITINGEEYYAYDILDEMDSSNKYELLREYCESQNDNDIEEAEYELDRADPGDEVYIQCYTVEVLEDDTESEESGDYDGDNIENVRKFIEEQNILKQSAAAAEKKTEDDMMKMFQVIG